MYGDRFPPHSSFIQIYYKDMQVHANLCKFVQYYARLLFFYSLSRVFFTSLKVLLFLFLLVVHGVLFSRHFHPGLSLHLEMAAHPLAK